MSESDIPDGFYRTITIPKDQLEPVIEALLDKIHVLNFDWKTVGDHIEIRLYLEILIRPWEDRLIAWVDQLAETANRSE